MSVRKSPAVRVLTAEQRRQFAIKRKLFGCGSRCAICLPPGYSVSHAAPRRSRRPRRKEDYKFLYEAARSVGYAYKTNGAVSCDMTPVATKKSARFVAYHDLQRSVEATKRMQAHKRKLLRKQLKKQTN